MFNFITYLEKKGSLDKLENYMPIGLTNVDYKIIAFFFFAKRLQRVMNSTINQNQTGHVNGRFIGNNARLTRIL